MKEIISSLILIFFWTSCSQEPESLENNKGKGFREINTHEAGIDFRNDLKYSAEHNIIEYLYFNNGGGVGVGDIDNDGLEDVLLTANQKSDQLYKNLGNLQFENITEYSNISQIPSWSTGVAIDDVNGDGWNDIYVCKVSEMSSVEVHNELYINQKDGTFKEMAQEYGLDFKGYSTQASFFDYDKDGDLDMYLLNHSVHSTKSYGSIEKREEKDEVSGDRIYENRINEKEGRFIDNTSKSEIYSSALGYGLGLVTSDLNNDGWVDIYVGNDFHENDYIYINNRDGTFTEDIKGYMTHSSQFTMGVDAADINGDGFIDIFTTDMMPYSSDILMKSGGNDTEQIVKIKKDFGYHTQYSRNMMQLKDKRNGFSEQAFISETYASDWSWSVLLQDFNNNGNTDIYISNGIVNRPNDLDYIQYINTPANRQNENESTTEFNQRLINKMPTLKLRNVLFTQNNDLKFSAIHESSIGKPNYSNGSAYADLDMDGDLDIISNNVNGPISLLENLTVNSHFVSFDLSGDKHAVVEVFTRDKVQKKEYTTARGYQSSSTHYLHFGLGSEVEIIDSILIKWSDGSVQVEKEVPMNKHVILEKKRSEAWTGGETKGSFALSILPIEHKENDYDDIDHEPLLLYKFSKEGPATIYEDFDKDGFKDLLIGGAKNDPISYYRGGETVPFTKTNVPVFVADSRYEDVNAAIIDFNNDGYKDIYVVSGGNEYNELDKNLEDRLYINDQKGSFFRLEISLPHTNGSCVAVSDFDGDGFEDFFVGSRNVPGAFGLSPVSFIIKNVNGQRLEIVERGRYGMVSEAQWIDINDNGSEELILVGDWMPVKILSYNGDSSFNDIASLIGIPDVRGLFRCVETGDFNKDGYPDLALGNIGLNTFLKIGEKGKINLYLSDFDNNSFIDPIVFSDFFGNNIPFADKVSLQRQIPSIKKAFPSFQKFGQISSIDDIRLEDEIMETKYINTLSSIVVLSHENGYIIKSLPRECQISNIQDFSWVQNSDGTGELFYVGNNRSNSHVLSQTLASRGGVLSGFGNKEIEFLSHESLPLPQGIVSRKIFSVNSDKFLVINNSAVQYQIQRK